MKSIKFLICFSLFVTLAFANDKSSEEVPPQPPSIITEPAQPENHTNNFDPENCKIDPPPTDEELTEYFEWMDKHNKNWRNATQRKCKLIRVVYNMREIKAHNQRFKEGKETYEKDLWTGSEFTDEEKFKEYKIKEFPQLIKTRQAPASLPNLPPPVASVDYREKGWISPSVPQNGCGSCWAFAAITPLEAQVRKCNISNETLSIQSMVDCCTVGCWGCQSGWPHYGYRWIRLNAIVTNASYPYTARVRNCTFDKTKAIALIDSHRNYQFPNGNASFIQQLVSTYGPVATVMCVEGTIFSYKSGVYSSTNPCTTPMHGVVIVGYGTDPVGGDFWIIKNSWGPGFGDNGFFKMKRGTNNCLIESNISIPFVKKLDGTPCPN
ncbi:hypothetical protein PVAND_006324 [Polypedilum vanderplanki]|uniref:Peptidase C1A papain C-terminal domain-containing protein n=1 Tax=Polypedilum vanderplanki TaxID=319348 RepID=A0A9J6C3L8_POLVA|nr:hypothetical protein PVAND_006324 [Polypedilum vanderplanki]